MEFIKVTLAAAIILFNFICCSQPKNKATEFNKFKLLFPIQQLPYNSSTLSNYSVYSILESEANKLDNTSCVKYFFNNDVLKTTYKYESFNMETGESKGMIQDEYSFYPAFRFETKEYVVLGFLKTSISTHEFYIAILKSNESISTDILEINRINEELLPELFEFSTVDKNLGVSVFKYEQSPEYWKDIKSKDKNSVNKTLITHRVFQLDKLKGKFKLIKSDSSRSKCTISDFQSKKTRCSEDDPFIRNQKN
ncbi:MAG: hypothetical protein K2U26_16695 [Cyclobacteriaceae bacterium]|nr:hypothetical protein [Cyclobacteriaceae bacterium]